MPGEYAIPNWIQPADEAGHYARGLQIGAQIGEAQAAQLQQQHQMELAQQKNQFAQAMELRDQQLKANQDARAQAELGLRASEAARKTEGMMEYQRRVQAGEDPMKVILEVGPKIGMTGPTLFSAMRNQAQWQDQQKQQSAAPDVQDLPNGYKVARWGKQEFLLHPPQAPKPAAQWNTEMRDDGQGGQYAVQINQTTGEEKAAPRPPVTGRMSQVDRDEIREMEHDLYKLQTEQDKDTNGQLASTLDPKALTPARKAILDQYNKRAKQMQDLSEQISNMRAKIRGGDDPHVPKAAPKSKVARAKELSKAHPEWNKQQVIDAVNQEYAATSPTS